MDWKWIETATLMEAPAGGPSGPPAAVSDPTPEPTEIDAGSDTGGDEEPADAGVEAAPEEPAAPAAAPPPDDDDFEMPVPEALSRMFIPATPGAPPQGAPQAAPGQPPPPQAAPGMPDPSLALTDPEKWARDFIAYNQANTEKIREEALRESRRVEYQLRQQQVQRFEKAVQTADRALKSAYAKKGSFAKDPDFRNSKDMQAVVQDLVGYYIDGRLQQGDIEGLEHVSDPVFARRVLQLAKAELGVTSGPSSLRVNSPIQGQQPAAKPRGPVLDNTMQKAQKVAAAQGFKYTAEQLARAMKRRQEAQG